MSWCYSRLLNGCLVALFLHIKRNIIDVDLIIGIKWNRIQLIIVKYKFPINWWEFTTCCLWLLTYCNILCLHISVFLVSTTDIKSYDGITLIKGGTYAVIFKWLLSFLYKKNIKWFSNLRVHPVYKINHKTNTTTSLCIYQKFFKSTRGVEIA